MSFLQAKTKQHQHRSPCLLMRLCKYGTHHAVWSGHNHGSKPLRRSKGARIAVPPPRKKTLLFIVLQQKSVLKVQDVLYVCWRPLANITSDCFPAEQPDSGETRAAFIAVESSTRWFVAPAGNLFSTSIFGCFTFASADCAAKRGERYVLRTSSSTSSPDVGTM